MATVDDWYGRFLDKFARCRNCVMFKGDLFNPPECTMPNSIATGHQDPTARCEEFYGGERLLKIMNYFGHRWYRKEYPNG